MSEQNASKPNPYSDEAQHELIDWNFTNHTPDELGIAAIEGLRKLFKQLGHVIIDVCPSGPDRTTAIRELNQALMTAVASIARRR